MYTRIQPHQSTQCIMLCLYRQFTRYFYSGNAKYKTIGKHFHKNITHYKYNGDDGYLNYNMYKALLKDRKSVSSSWKSYFNFIHSRSSKDSHIKFNSVRVNSSNVCVSDSQDGTQRNSKIILIRNIEIIVLFLLIIFR